MKHRLLSILITLLLLLSVCAVPFAEESASCEIYAEKISFCTEDGSAVTAESGAVLHAEANAEVISGGNYAFSILASDKGKLIAFETAYGTVEEDVTLVTPSITLPENVADVSVWAMLTDEDLNDMLVPMAVLGSNEAAVSKITVGGIEVPLEEGKTEYDMTVYLKEENFPPEVKVYTRDLSSSVYISESEDGIYTYDITVESCNLEERIEYRLNVTAYEVTDASLIGITCEYSQAGEKVKKVVSDFTPSSNAFNIDISEQIAGIPQIEAVPYNPNAKVEVTQAPSFPGEAVITVTSPDGGLTEEYRVVFRKVNSQSFVAADRTTHFWNTIPEKPGQGESAYYRGPLSNSTTSDLYVKSKIDQNCVIYMLYDFSDLAEDCIVVDAGISYVLSNVKAAPQTYYWYRSTYENLEDIPRGNYLREFAPRLWTGSKSPVLLGSATVNETLGANTKKTFEAGIDFGKIGLSDEKTAVVAVARNPEDENSTSQPYYYGKSIITLYYIDGEYDNEYPSLEFSEYTEPEQEDGEKPEIYEPSVESGIVWTTENSENTININVSGDLSPARAGEKVVLKLMRGTEAAETNLGKYGYFGMIYADDEGKIDYTFRFNDASDDYKLSVKSESMETSAGDEIFVPSQQTLNELLSDIASEEVSPEALAENMKTGVGELGLDGELYNKVTPEAQKNVAEYIKENIEESNIDGFVSAYEEAMLIKGISGAEASAVSEILTSYGEETQITENALYEEFDALTDGKKLEVYEMLSDGSYEDISGVEKALYGSVAAVKLRGISSFNDVGNIISSYGDYMGSGEEIAAYEALNRNLTDKVNLIMADELSSDDTLENILSKLDSAIAKAKKEAAQQASSPSGGGGGGKGGGFVAPPVTPPVSMEKIEESSAKNGFSDVPETHWGFEAITKLAEKKIISGRSESIFDPDAVITRAEFTKLAVSALGLYNENAACDFSDVDSSFWGYRYIASAVENKLVNGMDENKFGTALNISRQDAAVILYRAKGWEPVKTEEFADDGLIGDYARDALYSLKDKGILTGYENNIRPADSLTRAEAAQIIFKLLSI